MATLHHELWIDAPAAAVFRAIATAEGIGKWWAPQTVRHTPAGTVLDHDPGPPHGIVSLRIVDIVENRRIEWECVSHHSAESPASAWTGTHIVFEISRRAMPPWAPAAEQKELTVLDFRHTGWEDNSQWTGFCNSAWGEVLQSLKKKCEAAA